MHIHVSIVSHGHFNLIKELNILPELSSRQNISVYLLDNIGENGFKDWCSEHQISFLKNDKPDGFGSNNNKIFEHIILKNEYSQEDYFLILNPDIIIEADVLIKLVSQLNESACKVSTINLFKDLEFTQYDHSVRQYPDFFDYMQSMFLGKNPSILNKNDIKQPTYVDWAAGSFLLFDIEHFKKLNGFDTSFYMYCEDVDICLRSDLLFDEKVLYFPQVKAVHLARHASRSLFSKHLYWHLSSMFRYLWKKRKLKRTHSGNMR